MLICSKWQFQSVDGCGVGYLRIHNKRLKNLQCTLFVIKLNFTKQNKTFQPFFFNYFCKKYQMLAPWNGSHRKTGFRVPGFRSIYAVVYSFYTR